MSKLKLLNMAVKRCTSSVKFSEDNFMRKVALYNKAVLTKDKGLIQQAFKLKESARNSWYKDIDAKMESEQSFKRESAAMIAKVVWE